jgi:hypothetical protein
VAETRRPHRRDSGAGVLMRSKFRRTIAAPIRAIGILQFILGVTDRLFDQSWHVVQGAGRLADAGLLETEWEDRKSGGRGTAAAPPLPHLIEGERCADCGSDRTCCTCPPDADAPSGSAMSSVRELPDSRTMSAILRWVTFYTRFVPARVAQERYDELRSDLYEQVADGVRRGLSRGSIDRAIAGRALRGLAADLSWSRKQHQRKEAKMSNPQTASEPTNGPISIRLSSLAWFVLALLAVIGLGTSITELVEYGGNRFGFVPWRGPATSMSRSSSSFAAPFSSSRPPSSRSRD